MVLTVSALSACNKKTDEERQTYPTQSKEISYMYFNTFSLLTAYGDTSSEEFDTYVKEGEKLLKKYHQLFDIYYEYSGINNIRTINKNAGVAPVEVDEELIIFLEYCKQLYTITNGKTNIMLGSVLTIWHNYRETATENPEYASVPGEEMLADAARHVSIDSLVIDKEAGTVYITDPQASIDVGAIGKGYAVERLYEMLKEMGADAIAINVGGNIRTIGTKPYGEKWITGITNPDRTSEQSFIRRVAIGDVALVTSGDYERYYYVGGRKYHHIIDPDTLMPAEYFSSVSVFTKDSGLADALSTALFCMSYEEGLEIINSIGGVEALWVYRDGTVKHTNGIEFVD